MLDHYENKVQACVAETKTQGMKNAELWHARIWSCESWQFVVITTT